MKEITSVHNETIKKIEKLKDKKNRIAAGVFIVEGYHLVEEAYKHQMLLAVLCTKAVELQKYANLDTYLVNNAIIEKLSSTKSPQGIIGIVRLIDDPQTQIQSMLQKESVKIALFDNINDPGNLGTMIRTAAALSYDLIIMSPDCVDFYNDKSLRASQGSIFKIPLIKSDLLKIVPLLQKNNIRCIGTSLQNAKSLTEITKPTKFALCFGNEANGVSETLLNLMDERIVLKMHNEVESLNVMVASSIIMYEFIRN